MIAGRSLELYFVDGKPDGMLTAEVFNWTGHVLVIPKIRLPHGLKRTEAKQTGVYILLGEGDEGSLAYIGEAEDMALRLREHASQKDWWTQAILITTAGDALHKAHVKYLESRLVELAKEAGSVALENANVPPRSSLNEAATANMESFLSTLRMVLPAVRVDILESRKRPLAENVDSEKMNERPTFELRVEKHNITAKAQVVGGEFVLLTGAKIAPLSEVRSYLVATLKRRTQAKEQGIIDETSVPNILTQNIAFNSPSGAGDFVTGRSCNGRLEWRLATDGRNFAEWEDEQLTMATGWMEAE